MNFHAATISWLKFKISRKDIEIPDALLFIEYIPVSRLKNH